MPTYTYECKKCSHEQDVFHGMNAKPRVKCEECGGMCKKLLGAGAGIIFKGSGFYETDYKRNGGKPADSGKSETGGDDSKSSTDTKSSGDSATKSDSSEKSEKTGGTTAGKSKKD